MEFSLFITKIILCASWCFAYAVKKEMFLFDVFD